MFHFMAFWIPTIVNLHALVSATCLHGTTIFARAGADGELEPFGYTDRISALNWANLSPENIACSTSKFQSPINLYNGIAFAKFTPKLEVPMVNGSRVLNIGTTIVVEVNGATNFGDQTFRLKQFHFHTPSEHRIEEEYFPLEIHMVHENIGIWSIFFL